jgi:DNA (cytosine-5)-methyltransferase 1
MRRIDYESETLVSHALCGEGFDASEDGTGRGTPIVPVLGVALRGRDGGATAEVTGDVMTALRCGGGGGDKPHALLGHRVRRLTPRECERLQGFPDDYTLIPQRKGLAADGPRYKALGNSMAVNVMAWIGARISMVESLEGGIK